MKSHAQTQPFPLLPSNAPSRAVIMFYKDRLASTARSPIRKASSSPGYRSQFILAMAATKFFFIFLFSLLYPSFATPLSDQTSNKILHEISFPLHGNWCGLGHGGPASLPCIDDVDCACKAHDLCYEEYWFANCKCDWDLAKALDGRKDAKSIAMRAAISISPCTGPKDLKVDPCTQCKKVFGSKICYATLCEKCVQKVPAVGEKWEFKRYKC